MAAAEIRPDWTIGTLNLTSGSTAFTTTGSMLQTAAIQPGDEIITRSGLVLIIASITGQNSGTLMEPCPAGAAGSGQPLRIRFQPDGSRYNGATADLVQLLSSGNVHSLSGIVGANNTMPYFTGVGTMGRTPLTAFARSLLDDTNAAGMLTTLGFSSFMRSNVGIDSFYGWGLENVSNNVPNDNLDTLRTNGVYRASGSMTGAPNSSINQILHMGQGANYAIQIAFPLTLSTIYFHQYRTLVNNVWTDWRPLVAQRSSNANGEYVRFADGTQICWSTINLAYASNSRLEASWTYPAVFSGDISTRSLHAILPYQYADYVGISPSSVLNINTRASSVNTGSIGLYGSGFSSGNTINNVQVMSTGRWY